MTQEGLSFLEVVCEFTGNQEAFSPYIKGLKRWDEGRGGIGNKR